MTFDPHRYRDQVVVMDGDLGAEVLSRGWPRDVIVERANLTRPDIVRDAIGVFLDAGAEAIVTNTAAAGALALAWRGVEATPDEIRRLNLEGATLARSAITLGARPATLVFGAIGPPGGLLSFGEFEADALRAATEHQANALREGAVDAILCTGFTELESLEVVVRCAMRTGLPVFASMIFDSGPDRTETAMGVTVPQACTALVAAGAAGIGCEGGDSPDTLADAVALARAACDLPIAVRVSAGLPELQEDSLVYTEIPAEFGARLNRLVAAGATFIGGDRGVRPEHVAALVAARARLRPAR